MFAPMSRLLTIAGCAIDAIRINATCHHVREGRAVLLKRRRRGSGFVVKGANFFFRLAQQPVFVWDRVDFWQRWEVECFQKLHGGSFHATAEGARTVCVEKMPGKSIAQHFVEGTFEEEMVAAAAREMRRAHALWCDEFGGSWSHGDANLANFLYDETARCARLIDFELIHKKMFPAGQRHADDLLVFLQDLLGCIARERWVPVALRFLQIYDRPEIVRILEKRLFVPRGVPLVWWIIRANYVTPNELKRRIGALRQALAEADESEESRATKPREFCSTIHSRTG